MESIPVVAVPPYPGRPAKAKGEKHQGKRLIVFLYSARDMGRLVAEEDQFADHKEHPKASTTRLDCHFQVALSF
jgi:hypothetical protein